MKRVLILTDSLALPRENPEMIKYDQTWVNLLKKHYDIIQSSIGGATSFEIYCQACSLRFCEPEITLIQVGVVDCAPRALTQLEDQILNKYWITRVFLKVFMPHFSKFLRKYRKISYQSPKKFIKYLREIKELLAKSDIYALSILPASDQWEEKVPGIKKKVYEYNTLLSNEFGPNFIDLSDINMDGIMSDFHHINAIGHSFIYQKVVNNLKEKYA